MLRIIAALFLLLGLAFPQALAAVKEVNGISIELNLDQAQRGAPYSYQLAPSGGTGPYTFAIVSGSLPFGLKMSASGLVSGVSCAANGTYVFGLVVTDALSLSAQFTANNTSLALNLTAAPGVCTPLVLTSTASSSMQVGVAYSQTNTASGGTTPYTYSISGTLPAGVTFDASTGTVSGTPTAAGSFNYTVTVTDAAASPPLGPSPEPLLRQRSS
jgi:hypothetical protein